MSFLQKVFGPDPETEKQTAFQEIGRQFKGGEINKAKAGWFSMRGNKYATRRRFDVAISDFKEALEYEPNRLTTMISLGMAYSYTKLFNEAVEILEKAKEFLSSMEDEFSRLSQEQQLNYHLGNTYYFLGNEKQAIKHLKRSLEIIDDLTEFKKQGKISDQAWNATQIIWEPMLKNIRGLPLKLGARIEILGKSRNWNKGEKCDYCQRLIGDADKWEIDSISLGDQTRKYSNFFSVCEVCYSREYDIYPQEERTQFDPPFFSEYSKLSIEDRNLKFFESFPKEFWDDLQINKTQGLSLFDFLLSGEEDPLKMRKVKIPTEQITEIMDEIDEYTADAANTSSSKRFKHKVKATNGEYVFFYDPTIPDKLNKIKHGELLILGFRIFETLSDKQKQELRSKYAESIFTDDNFQRHIGVVADTLVTSFLDNEGIYKKTITPTMSFMVVGKIGLLKYLHWLRKAQIRQDLAKWASSFLYSSLLDMK